MRSRGRCFALLAALHSRYCLLGPRPVVAPRLYGLNGAFSRYQAGMRRSDAADHALRRVMDTVAEKAAMAAVPVGESLLETTAQAATTYSSLGSMSGSTKEDAKMAQELDQILTTLQQRYIFRNSRLFRASAV